MTITRRSLLTALVCLATPSALYAQQPGQTKKLGILATNRASDADMYSPTLEELRKLGWIPGVNLIVERRYSERDSSRLQTQAEALVA